MDHPAEDIINELIDQGELPTLPVVASALLDLSSNPDVELRQIADIIEFDQGISTKVLRTINSSFYGLQNKCVNIRQALAYLGLNTVRGLVMGFSLARMIDGGGDEEVTFDFRSYWRRSIWSAAAARQIASRIASVDPDECFLAALIQDVGMVAMSRRFGDAYLQIMDICDDASKLPYLENKHFHIDHCKVGYHLCESWRLPDSICEVVKNHHSIDRASLDTLQIMRILTLSNHISVGMEHSLINDDQVFDSFKRRAREWYGIRGTVASGMLSRIRFNAQELASAFDLSSTANPSRSLGAA